jgi:hypothetical protein
LWPAIISSPGLIIEAGETQDRVQLNRARRHTRLAVVEVEEGDTGDASSSAELDVRRRE